MASIKRKSHFKLQTPLHSAQQKNPEQAQAQ
jgi:hypothetical protein